MKKVIKIQSQGVQSPAISPVKEIGWCAINLDGIKIVLDAYNGSGPSATPRTNSLVQIIDEKEVFEMTPEVLLQVVRFFKDYSAMGTDVISYKNMFHVIVPDDFKVSQKR